METHVMIKTHNITGLKYLCKTTCSDPYKYKGSGTYWLRHLKKHGDDITTQVILRSSCNVELEDFSLEMSRVFDVVASDGWANLVPENGLDGMPLGAAHSEETKAKLSAANMGKKRPSFSDETKTKMSVAQKGKVLSEETRAKISMANKGKKRPSRSDETKTKTSVSIKAHWAIRKLNKDR